MKTLEMLLAGAAATGTLLTAGNGAATSVDPVVVNAGMEHARLENDRVRVIEGVIPPGGREKMHSHPAFVTYVIAGGRIRNHFADGTVVDAELETGAVLWRDPQTHWVENVGTTTLRFIVVELRNAR
jgi:quercetin dioxygenase-like cupin family protein